jgi:transcriptional regulator with XRE-family HTH domain
VRGLSAALAEAPIGRQLAAWRAIHDVDQEVVAARLGVSQAAVSRYESGLRQPSAAVERLIREMIGR